jgi:hypothetical protein
MNMFDKLSAPFPVDAIHWRAQTMTKDGGSALALAYIDARDVMDRLDAVCGPAGWQDSYTETPKGRLICTLSILSPEGEWISKSDGAGDTDVEGDKGAISDALKRAAVKWGIGRYLYGLKDVWAPCQSYEANGKKRWSKWLPAADAAFKRALNGQAPAMAPIITGEQLDELQLLFDHLNVPVAEFLAVGKIKRLSELAIDRFDGAKTWINNRALELRQQKEAA